MFQNKFDNRIQTERNCSKNLPMVNSKKKVRVGKCRQKIWVIN